MRTHFGKRLFAPTLMVAAAFIGSMVIARPVAHASAPLSTISSATLPAGELRPTDASGAKLREFPLKHTSVQATVRGFVAQVEVRQEYVNPYHQPIEAVYVFPLPHDAAVYDMEMTIGDRRIRADIQRREEARRTYEAAKRAGQRAGLLEQERPNVFTQSVANILPGDHITIVIRYTQTLTFDEDRYQFVFPMVVGPRYIPGEWVEEHFVPGVSDFDRINPPVVPPGVRSGHDIDLTLDLDTGGIPITDLRTATHQVVIDRTGEARALVRIREDDTIPNKDFVFEYELASTRPQFALFAHRPSPSEPGFFTLMIQPQTDFTVATVTPKEIFFLVDASGSMSGAPITKMQEAMRHALTNLNPEDTFSLAQFSNVTVPLSGRPLPATPDNLFRGLEFIDDIAASGGTEMLPGILEVLEFPHDSTKLRIVVVMSDGLIGNEPEILSAIEQKLGDQSRLFTFGIGSSTNRYLLDGMARIGRGTSTAVPLRQDTREIIEGFYDRIASPLFTDITIDWGGLQVDELYPARIPDLFAGQPLYLHGRYRTPASGTVHVSGRIAQVGGGVGGFAAKLVGRGAPVDRNTELFALPTVFPEREPANEWTGRLWARSKIRDLMDQMFRGEVPSIVEAITQLGLRHRLVTSYTSFVAVEETPVAEPGQAPVRVAVPVELPEGTTYEGFFGSERSALPTSSQSSPSLTSGITTGMSYGVATGFSTRRDDREVAKAILRVLVVPALLLLPFLIGAITGTIVRRAQRRRPERTPFHRIFWRTVLWSTALFVIAAIATVSLGYGADLTDVGALALVWLITGIIVYLPIILGAFVSRVRRRRAQRRGQIVRTGRSFAITTIVGYLVLIVLGVFLFFLVTGNLVEFARRFVFSHLPIAVLLVLLASGALRWMTWQRVLLVAVGILTASYAFSVYAILRALRAAPHLFSGTRMLADPRIFLPFLLLAAYLVVVLMVRSQRRSVYLAAGILALISILRTIGFGWWPLTTVGWPLLSVAMLVSVFFLWKAPAAAPSTPPQHA